MSLRSFFKQLLPESRRFRDHEHLRHFGDLLHDTNIWHLNRRSACGGIAIGLFIGLLPIPGQMIAAAALAIMFRVNLPLAAVLTWVTNPLTFAPIYFFAYELGSWLLDTPVQKVNFELSMHWLHEIFVHIWQPLLLGSVIIATMASLASYYATSVLWRILLLRKRASRRSNQ